ncbi:hypothetical protein GZ78_00560 [Endozoicomonas numazuensis]|uniref:Uncharacterized protein n=1 Tax=Endozoicomonas numazuensis TaxID=1137799 RepID=A0A081NJN3_9GAMM|nr:hypothetical protein GZ78_00560 [Endozoicomonas numazuensis]
MTFKQGESDLFFLRQITTYDENAFSASSHVFRKVPKATPVSLKAAGILRYSFSDQYEKMAALSGFLGRAVYSRSASW